ncbi:CHAT domain-containing tetratricopeptide repeat protein [Archangium lansingense]|uniref:Tetratricopeptide repeat protein n=1 Tax=Archangium lansingense TaxID=2995310 RepID=A0ABT4A7M8_9BACT|nr:tetratricopeptide repeat protein [Archangium lansinium]MCY1077668.1 tetratricopeptide repeat protein [Archangium lansinium]
MVLLILGCAACATVEKVPVDARLVEAQKAFDEAMRSRAEGRFADAVPPAERALELREAALGNAHPEVARCLSLLGVLHMELQDYVRAEQLHQRALAIREAALGRDHPDAAASLNSLALLYKHQGDYRRAVPLLQRALEIWEAALGGNHPHVAAALQNLAQLYNLQGLYARAEPLYVRALGIFETAFGEEHLDVASSLNNLAGFYYARGNYDRAESLFLRALKIRRKALGENHAEVAGSLHNLGTLHIDQGHYQKAESDLLRALAIRETALGEKHSQVADSLCNLAILYELQGRYARAEQLYQRALAIREAIFGKNHPDVAESLKNFADVSARQGQYERARPLYERVLAIHEANFGENHPLVASVLHNLGDLDMEEGHYGLAEPRFLRAIEIREAALGGNHPDVANSLQNLATIYRERGDYAGAEPLYARALAIWEKALGSNNPDVASLLYEFATLYSAQGDYARAELLHERALSIREAVLGKGHPDVAHSLQALARLQLERGHLSAALPLFERAFTIHEDHLRQEVYGFSEARLASVLRLLRTDEERLYALARAHPGNDRVRQLALSTVLLRKGRSAEEIAETSRIIYRGLGQADREAFERLRALRTQLARLSLASAGTSLSADHQQRLKELTDQGDALEADLARRSGPLRTLFARPSLKELIGSVAAALPDDGALVEFIAYEDRALVSTPGFPTSRRPGQLRYLALLLFADGRTHALDLGPAAPIDQASLRLHAALADRDVSYQSKARAFYVRAFQPLIPLLGKARRLFISPDSQLALVPFAALHDGRQFLVDRFDITYVTSGKDLLTRSANISPAQSVVVMADPDFDSALGTSHLVAGGARLPTERSASLERFFFTLRPESRDQPLLPLPGTRKEAEAIQRLLPQARTLMGRDATKEALLTLATPGVLHIATHGFFLEDAKAQVGTRAVGHCCAAGEIPPISLSDEPLLRSGLVLAGARASSARSDASRREESWVTALELAGLDLWGTQLVVLSACDTGRGHVKLGQGVYGLRRALMVAGAQTLVTSLWKVRDEATHQLMDSYYRNLLAGQGRGEALRSAMRELRKRKPHPYYWAPFIAIGQDKPLQGLLPTTGVRSTP